MGWTATNKPAGMSAAEFIKENCWGSKKSQLIASAQVGEYVYFALKTKPEPESYLTKVYEVQADGSIVGALVYLVDNKRGIDGYSFAYKDMDETMGPCDDGKCPAEILKMLTPIKPGAETYAKAWRGRQKAWSSVTQQVEMAL